MTLITRLINEHNAVVIVTTTTKGISMKDQVIEVGDYVYIPIISDEVHEVGSLPIHADLTFPDSGQTKRITLANQIKNHQEHLIQMFKERGSKTV